MCVTGFTLIGAAAWVTPVFDGGVLMVAVFVSTVVGRRRADSALSVVPEPDETVPMTGAEGVTAKA
jgi:hypothetical protein